MTAQEDVKKFGFVNQPIDSNIDLKSEILRMKKPDFSAFGSYRCGESDRHCRENPPNAKPKM